MDDKRILKNIGVSMLMRPASMLLSFLYTPLALSFLGQEKNGVWVIVCNIMSWINYFDIGIGNGLRNRLAEAYALEDYDSSQKYVSTAYLGTTVISAIFGIGLVLVWNIFKLADFFNLNVANENINVVIGISLVCVCINFVFSLSKTSAYAIQQPGIISAVGVLAQAIQLAALYVISINLNQSLTAVAIMYGAVSLLESLIVYRLVTRKRRYLRPSISKIDAVYLKPLLTLGVGFFIMQICTLVLNTTDNLLISNLYGSAEVTPYNMVYKVFYIPVQVHGIIIMPMWSAYTEALAKRDMAWIKRTIRRINIITVAFSLCTAVGIVLFEPFAAIWLGQRLEYGTSLIVIVALYMIAQMFANNYSSFLCGVGHIKISTVLAAVGAVLNVPLSIFFAQVLNMRLAGIILGSLCVMMMSFVILPVVSGKWIRAKEKEWIE